MKKIYIKPLAECVTLNVSGDIMDVPKITGASQETATDDPNGANKTEGYLKYDGNTSTIPGGWGGHAKQYSAWDTWDD